MAAIDTLRDALFGNPPDPTTEPSREGVLAAFTELYGQSVTALYASQAGVTIVANVAARDVFYATPANRSKLVYVNNNNGQPDDPANGVYEWVSGSARIAEAFYESVAVVVQPLVDQAQSAAQAAELARDIAVTEGPYYSSQAAGEAATVTGEDFAVAPGDGTASWRKRTGGGSTLLYNLVTGVNFRVLPTAGSVIGGSSASGANLNNNAAGAHDGDAITAFGTNNFVFAEYAYASDAFGYGTLYKFGNGASGPDDAHSGAAFAYQAGHNVERGVGFFLAGVDAAFAAVEINGAVILGRHVFNLKAGNNAELTGVFVMAEQAFRYLGVVDDLIGGGRFTMANSPADGTGRSIVWGNETLISAKAYKSNISGHLIMASTTPLADPDYRIALESGLSGDRNHYGAKRAVQTESHGVEGFFLLLNDAHVSEGNTGSGYQHGYNVRGTYDAFFGYRAGARNDVDTATPVEVDEAVCIGPYAGYGMVESGEFYLGNSDSLDRHLLWGSFNDKILNARADKFFFVDDPEAANDTAASGAGIGMGQLYFDTTKGAYTKRVA